MGRIGNKIASNYASCPRSILQQIINWKAFSTASSRPNIYFMWIFRSIMDIVVQLIVASIFLVSLSNYKPYHIPLQHMYLI